MIAIQKNYLVRSRIELESEWQRFYLFIEPGEKNYGYYRKEIIPQSNA